MARVVLLAESFAYGPAGKLLTVAEVLHDSVDVELIFVGGGTARRLVELSASIDEVIAVEPGAPTVPTAAVDAIRSADIVVDCMDRDLAVVALEHGAPLVWIDTLFWWWEDIPSYLFDVPKYLAQRSLPAHANHARFASLITNLREVGPLVDRRPLDAATPSPERVLLVNFGGMEAAGWYEIGRDSWYPFVLTDLLARSVDLSSFDRVRVCGNGRVLELLEQRHGGGFEFVELGHQEFLAQLATADALLTVPGLETPLEAWTYRVPTVFLPPSNASQHFQLSAYRSAGLAEREVNFIDLAPGGAEALEGATALRARNDVFLELLAAFEHDERHVATVGRGLSEVLNDRPSWSDLVAAGDQFLASLGGNGIDAAVEEVCDVLAI